MKYAFLAAKDKEMLPAQPNSGFKWSANLINSTGVRKKKNSVILSPY